MAENQPVRLRDRKPTFVFVFTTITGGAILLTTLILSVIFFTSYYSGQRSLMVSALNDQLARTKEMMASHLDTWKTQIRYVAYSVAPNLEHETVDRDEIRRMFTRFIYPQKDIQLFYYSSNTPPSEPGGYIISGGGLEPESGYDWTREPWFTLAKENPGRVVYTNPFVDPLSNELVIAVSQTVYDESGIDIGVIAGDVSAGFFDELFAEMGLLPGQETYLINSEGLYVTNADPEAVMTKDYFTDKGFERFREEILTNDDVSLSFNEFFLNTSAVPQTDWRIVSYIPTRTLFAGILRMMAILGGITVLMLLVIDAVTITLARRMSAPLRNLASLATALANEDFSTLSPDYDTQESSQLAQGLNTINKNISALLHDLRFERDQITAMQRNVRFGVFLMDKDLVIQEHYSAALENIFMQKDLAGRDFLSLLSSSLTKSDLASVRDYFDMMIGRKVSQEKLDFMNPLDDLTYIHPETTAEKNIRCEFSILEQGSEMFILATVDDITTEKQLQAKLQKEHAQRDSEVHSLIEVIHLDPQVFSDFISDVEYNLNQVLRILQNQDIDSREALLEIYQQIHAVKSDAYILGLTNFGDKFQELENQLKELREKDNLTFTDLLHLTVDIEHLLGEQDKLVTVIEKIRDFNTKESAVQSSIEAMLESFRQACRRISGDLDKKVDFREDIDAAVLAKLPRREIKEIVTQLIRNAIYHGIETPAERRKSGKGETGVISLSVKKRNGVVCVQVRDDGKGLDFTRIGALAKEQHLQTGENTKEKIAQLIFRPGFSTADDAGAHAGRGIGLSLVRTRIKAMNGSIKLNSQPGKGMMFEFDIHEK